MKKKEPLGFKTPAMQMQEEYKEVLEQLMSKKADWEKILMGCMERYKFADEGAGNVIEQKASEEIMHEDLMEVEHRVSLMVMALTQVMVARVGKELAECGIRISEVEKKN
ncbi:hypothetical protein ES703_39680 [subsurface metagenome]